MTESENGIGKGKKTKVEGAVNAAKVVIDTVTPFEKKQDPFGRRVESERLKTTHAPSKESSKIVNEKQIKSHAKILSEHKTVVNVSHKTSKNIEDSIAHGALKGIVTEIPKDEVLASFLSEVVENINNGTETWSDVYVRFRDEYIGKKKFQGEGQLIYERLLLKSRGETITPKNIEQLQKEGTGSPRATAHVDEIDGEGVVNIEDFNTGKNKEVQDFIKGLKNAFSGEIGDYETAKGVKMDIARFLKDKDHLDLDSQDIELLQNFRDKLTGLQSSLERTELSSAMYLTEAETREFIKNPALFFFRRINRLDRLAMDSRSSVYESTMARVKLAEQSFAVSNFDRETMKQYFNFSKEMLEQNPNLVEDFIKSVKEYSTSQGKIELSRIMEHRMLLSAITNMTVRGVDPKEIQKMISAAGEDTIWSVAASDGGLVGDLVGRLDNTAAKLYPNKRVTPQVDKQLINSVLDEFNEEANGFEGMKEKYVQFMSSFQTKVSEGDLKAFDEEFQSDEFRRSLVERSYSLWRVMGRKTVATLRSQSPSEAAWYGDVHPYQTSFAPEENNLAVARYRDWGTTRKFLKSDTLPWLKVGAEFYVDVKPKLKKFVSKRTDELWEAMNAQMPVGGTSAEIAAWSTTKKTAMDEVAKMLKFNDPAGLGKDITYDNFETKILELMKQGKLYKFDVKKWVTIEEGGARIQRLFWPYFFFSGWRIDNYGKNLGKMYVQSENCMLGAKLFKAYDAYHFQGLDEHGQEKQWAKNLKPMLERVAKERPQALLDILNRGHNEALEKWFETGARPGRLFEGFQTTEQLFEAVNRRYILINTQLQGVGLPSINYENINSITPEQNAVVDRVFHVAFNETNGGQINSKERYLSIMSQMKELAQEQIDNKELGSVKYENYLTYVNWMDDIFAHNLVNLRITMKHSPSLIKPEYLSAYDISTSNEAALAEVGFNKMQSEEGKGSGSPALRAKNDEGKSADCKDKFESTADLNPEEKIMLPVIKEILEKMMQYQTQEKAGEAQAIMSTIWLKMRQMKELGPLAPIRELFKETQFASIARSIWGGDAPADSMDETVNLIEKIDLLTKKLEIHNPTASHEMEEYLGVSTLRILGYKTPITWEKIFKATGGLALLKQTEKIPLLGRVLNPKLINSLDRTFKLGLVDFKERMALAYMSLLLMVYTFQQAKGDGDRGK